MKQILVWLSLSFLATILHAQRSVNVYAWGGEIPSQVIQQFEQEKQIKVNFSTYDSNETLYTKLKASQGSIYDVILPSGYFVERMKKQGMLQKLDPKLLPNLAHVASKFKNNAYDPANQYSAPLLWGTTGIFYNQNLVPNPPKAWIELWSSRWQKQLLLLEDSREIFALALMSLGYDPNDISPQHIKEAFNHLLKLIPNIKLFASDGIQAILIDEDAITGSAWNGDVFKAQNENKTIQFIYPQEGFVIWVDCLAMPINPPHLKEAYEFIDYLLKPETGAKIALLEGHAITNAKAKKLLPAEIAKNPLIYPPPSILKKGHFQRDVGEATLALYNKYWQQLKLAF